MCLGYFSKEFEGIYAESYKGQSFSDMSDEALKALVEDFGQTIQFACMADLMSEVRRIEGDAYPIYNAARRELGTRKINNVLGRAATGMAI